MLLLQAIPITGLHSGAQERPTAEIFGGARTPSTSESSESSSGDEQTPDPGQTFRPDPGQTCRLDPGHRPDVRTASDVAETCPRSPSGRREAAEEVGNTETSPLTGEGSVSDDADQVSSLSDSPRQHSDQSVAYRSDGDSVSVGSPTASSPQSSQSSESDCERTRQPAADTAQQRYDSLCRSLETLICSAESEEPARGEPAVSGGRSPASRSAASGAGSSERRVDRTLRAAPEQPPRSIGYAGFVGVPVPRSAGRSDGSHAAAADFTCLRSAGPAAPVQRAPRAIRGANRPPALPAADTVPGDAAPAAGARLSGLHTRLPRGQLLRRVLPRQHRVRLVQLEAGRLRAAVLES
ncbi:G protein-regulated inducer of neurite outgrowth 1-like [Amphibalanus amphitrite]|uniref:G protein-regulated inducer of neurite outgrowth 1-like n=1 Tax=Amphibalanus amphitrite TaxID=1232801 RepID=UPI001C922EE3|nr:G protein-regulated inducer of neurite outgrowth 1-like [Amphibalanus amphitrite]XP_043198987.1 G protein-regulated inducer of neurite outgrowth 1-like [Amphibalanus amphitrite]